MQGGAVTRRDVAALSRGEESRVPMARLFFPKAMTSLRDMLPEPRPQTAHPLANRTSKDSRSRIKLLLPINLQLPTIRLSLDAENSPLRKHLSPISTPNSPLNPTLPSVPPHHPRPHHNIPRDTDRLPIRTLQVHRKHMRPHPIGIRLLMQLSAPRQRLVQDRG